MAMLRNNFHPFKGIKIKTAWCFLFRFSYYHHRNISTVVTLTEPCTLGFKEKFINYLCHKFKVAVNPKVKEKYIEYKHFHHVVYELLESNGLK